MMRQKTDTRQTTIMHSYATERDAVRAIAALRADGFGAETIGVLGRHRSQEQAVARLTAVTPLEVVHVGRILGAIVGGALGLLAGDVVAVMPAVSLPLAVATIVVMALVGIAGGSVGGERPGRMLRDVRPAVRRRGPSRPGGCGRPRTGGGAGPRARPMAAGGVRQAAAGLPGSGWRWGLTTAHLRCHG